MSPTSGIFAIRNSIHADGWTETLAGIQYLIDQLDYSYNLEDQGNNDYLARLVIISSSYLGEQIFAIAFDRYINELLANDCNSATNQLSKRFLLEWIEKNSIQKVGISRAINEWPKILKGESFKLAEEPMQSFTLVMKKRNDIVHKLSDLTLYENAPDISRSALYTVIEASKYIWNYFYPKEKFPYEDWISAYPIPSANYFAKLKI